MAIIILIAGIFVGYFVYSSETGGLGSQKFPFRFGLDISGGTHLIYRADISQVDSLQINSSMEGLRDVIERRVNIFGVSEPLVQVEKGGANPETGDKDYRLIVELPGVTDVGQATAMIGQTPLLEFKTQRSAEDTQKILSHIESVIGRPLEEGEQVQLPSGVVVDDPYFVDTNLTGRFLDKASLQFGTSHSALNEPIVILNFDKEGKELFAQITKDNVGKVVAIYLDGSPISVPVVQEEITSGQAQISGGFAPDEAKLLVQRLNSGALPVPISLLSTQNIGASLGEEVLNKGIRAGVWGLILVAIFLLVWYRLPGLLAVVSLAIYILLMLVLFKLAPVTLTAAGIAGFILSIGMAVDANVLIFERMKEEIASGKEMEKAIREGFARAWLSIRDANLSSLITAVILFWFGTSLVEGFALTFGIGVLVSMFSAITITKNLLLSLGVKENKGALKFLFGSGIK